MEKLQPLINNHIAYCFEDLCRKYVKCRILDFNCVRIGRQWGNHYEIDIAGVDNDNALNLLGECKWSNKKVGLSIFRNLQDKIHLHKLPVSEKCKYIFFSKVGFSEDLISLSSKDENIVLIDSIFAL